MNIKPVSFLSFDIEALPGRAETDHINRLIWGKLGSGEYGIKRITSILGEHSIKGNFLLDLSGCALYGDRIIKEIGQFILSEGHELHVHLHSEWLVRKWGLRGNFTGVPGLNLLDEDTNQHLLSYSFFKYRQLFGKSPVMFRAGSFAFNAHTVKAAGKAGYKYLSNFNSTRHADMLKLEGAGAQNEPFTWDNGVIELPVDYSPEPLSSDLGKYHGWYDRVRDRKKIKTFNLTLHSWSLLKRTGEFFAEFAPSHEERLRYICEHLKSETLVSGYSDFLDGAQFPIVQTANFKFDATAIDTAVRLATCTICNAKFAVADTDVCPGCGSRARHRQVLDALAQAGNPFDNCRVLACYANSVEKIAILGTAKEVRTFDVRPLSDVDFQMDIQSMDGIPDGSFDGFMAVHVLNHVKDDTLALREIHRILRPGGVALITIPYRAGEATSALINVTEHYGQESLENYGVGSYRRYGLGDALSLFSTLFDVKTVAGYDPVQNESMVVFLLRKEDAFAVESDRNVVSP